MTLIMIILNLNRFYLKRYFSKIEKDQRLCLLYLLSILYGLHIIIFNYSIFILFIVFPAELVMMYFKFIIMLLMLIMEMDIVILIM